MPQYEMDPISRLGPSKMYRLGWKFGEGMRSAPKLPQESICQNDERVPMSPTSLFLRCMSSLEAAIFPQIWERGTSGELELPNKVNKGHGDTRDYEMVPISDVLFGTWKVFWLYQKKIGIGGLSCPRIRKKKERGTLLSFCTA